jgi:hypothetical protein
MVGWISLLVETVVASDKVLSCVDSVAAGCWEDFVSAVIPWRKAGVDNVDTIAEVVPRTTAVASKRINNINLSSLT